MQRWRAGDTRPPLGPAWQPGARARGQVSSAAVAAAPAAAVAAAPAAPAAVAAAAVAAVVTTGVALLAGGGAGGAAGGAAALPPPLRLPLRHSFQNTIAKIVTTKMRISSLATASGDMTPTVLSSTAR